MQLRWHDLRFTGPCAHLEAPFKATYIANSLGHVRLAAVLGLSLFVVFGVLDAMLIPEHLSEIWLIRYGLLCPAAIVAFAMTYAGWFNRYMQPIIATLVMFSGFCISAMTVIAPEPVSYSYYAGNILVIIFGYSFFRLRFVWATSAGWAIVGSYQIAAIGFSDTPVAVLVNNNFFFLSANVIGMFASYCLEQYARRDFYLVDALTAERAAVELAKEELEDRVEERTREATAAARSKAEFLANMSHEIRTPMNGVLGMLDLLRRAGLGRFEQEQAETAFRSAEGLLAILNDVLDLSKIEAGKMALDLESVAPGEIVEDVCAVLYHQARGKRLELVALLHPGSFTPRLLDQTRVRQILLNVLGNALKFTEHGHITVRCRCAESDDCIVIDVADTGIGIDEAQLETLFDAFAQGDNSTTRRFGGTGLGLTITHELTALMAGEISVTSSPGSGSCFTVRIPAEADRPTQRSRTRPRAVAIDVESGLLAESLALLAASLGWRVVAPDAADVMFTDRHSAAAANGRVVRIVDEDMLPPGDVDVLMRPIRHRHLVGLFAADAADDANEESDPPPPAVSDVSVLLVEDNEINRRVAGAMLGRLGVAWSHAPSGEAALDRYGHERFDLILMDCQMPGMDGFEATRSIRDIEALTGHHTPIVALTANAMEGDRERCLAAGMDDYLAKPVRISSLKDVIVRWTQTAVE